MSARAASAEADRSAPSPGRAPWPARRLFLLTLVVVAVGSAWFLELRPRGLLPGRGGLELTVRFFSAALTPALDYEEHAGLPADARAFLWQVGSAAVETVRVACAAVSLSIVFGLVLGFLGSSSWWPDRTRGAHRAIWLLARGTMTLLRSIHELIWATMFLAAFGLTPLTGVIAIAIPYTGTLAKVFSEMCEESPPDTRDAFRTLGASPMQFYFLGLTPRLMAELVSYSLYRFECGLRSAAVLGFLGIPTLGYHLKLAFENSHNHEVWTYLYAILALVVIFDQWSGVMRRRLGGEAGPAARPVRGSMPRVSFLCHAAGSESTRTATGVPAPEHDRLVQAGVLALAIMVGWAWISGGVTWSRPEGAWANVGRFVREAMPWPIQEGRGSFGAVWNWAADLMTKQGTVAAANTLAVSVVSIVLAAVVAWFVLPFAARNLASPHPFLPSAHSGSRLAGPLWRTVVAVSRFGLILSRAIPEYIWAFLFLAMVSSQSWAAVLALACHNAGILGRLGAEIVENADADVPRGLRALGATRGQVLGFALFPVGFSRFLVYFFYRWETCVRESTVLGLLGVATLGRLVADSRAMDRYDEMIFYVLLGAALVFMGDLFSALARRWMRV